MRLIISVICTNPRFKAPIWYACAPLSVTSPVANERVPSLSLSRLMVKALWVPSSSVLGTRNSPSPRVPAGAPSGRASVRIISAETLEQNHLSPQSSHSGCNSPLKPDRGFAIVVVSPTSDPPCFSVKNIAPCCKSSKVSAVREGRKRLVSSSLAYRSKTRANASVIAIGQNTPASACIPKYPSANLTGCGTWPFHPKASSRWEQAAIAKS